MLTTYTVDSTVVLLRSKIVSRKKDNPRGKNGQEN
jgi:hypothetical protein